MSSHVVTMTQKMMEKKRFKTKIGVGFIVKEKVGETEKKTREGRSRRTKKEVVGCVQDVVDKREL